MTAIDNSKILVIGISGTGKSTLSRKISHELALPLYHMDSVIWEENWKESKAEKVEDNLKKIVEMSSWVVEGWIDYYSKDLFKSASTVIYLDYPGWLAMLGGVQRWWRHRGSNRPEMPKGCNEVLNFQFLRTMLLRHERPHIEKTLLDFKPKNIIRFRSRQQAEQWLLLQQKRE